MNSAGGTKLKEHVPAVCIVLLAAVATFYGVLNSEFLTNWDDADYVTNNSFIRGGRWENIREIFSRPFLGNYSPIQMLSYLLDFSLWGLDPQGFHLTNLILHLSNGLLLYFLVLRMDIGRNIAVGAVLIFLLHPVQVETVAWVSQRKTLLAMVFFLASLHCYLKYVQCRGIARCTWFLLSLAAFTLSLLSKPVAVILPLVLLTCDLCVREDRSGWGKLLLEKVPFALFALAAGWVALMTQAPEAHGGRITLDAAAYLETMLTMLTVLTRYFLLIFWPAELSIVYSISPATGWSPALVAGLVLLAGATVIGRQLMSGAPKMFFWFSLFFIGLLPVSQLVPLVTLMNDRYLYIPMAGMATFISMAAVTMYHKVFNGKAPIAVLFFLLTVTLGTLSHGRVKVWHDTLSLWKDATKKSPASSTAWAGLGNALELAGNDTAALDAYLRALELNPTARAPLGYASLLYQKMGMREESQKLALRLVEYYPNYPDGWLTCGENFFYDGKPDKAESAFSKVLEIEPDNHLATAWLQKLKRAGRYDIKQRKPGF